MEDDIWWLICETPSEKLCYYLIAPYLNQDCDNYYAKLIYKTTKPFSSGNICKLKNNEKWYKTIHKKNNDKKITLDDSEIQKFSDLNGFEGGDKFRGHLTKIPKNRVVEILKPPSVISVYNEFEISPLLDRIAEFYSVPKNDILLSGSGGIFKEPLSQLNDLDILIPIDTIEQLNKIATSKVPSLSNSIKLKDKHWPLRWSKELDLIVCPFFLYRDLEIPIKKINSIKSIINGTIEITNISYGIFNLPIFECKGVINKIIINSSFVRGLLEVGMILNIKGEVYEIIDGVWRGEFVAILCDEIVNYLKQDLYLK